MNIRLVLGLLRSSISNSRKRISNSQTISTSKPPEDIWSTFILPEIPLQKYSLKLLSMNSIISIDYGTRKSGLAYSVEGFCFAWKTVSTSDLLTILPKWIQERKAEMIIIGMPYNIDGSMSKHGKRVNEFIKKLELII